MGSRTRGRRGAAVATEGSQPGSAVAAGYLRVSAASVLTRLRARREESEAELERRILCAACVDQHVASPARCHEANSSVESLCWRLTGDGNRPVAPFAVT